MPDAVHPGGQLLGGAESGTRRAALWTGFALSFLVLVLWQFPLFWYTRADAHHSPVWLTGQTNVPNWTREDVPVSRSAEAILKADQLLNAEFSRAGGGLVRVFSAKRYAESQNEIGLFVHTPDRCWTEAGWKLELVQPEYKQLLIHQLPVSFERRIFVYGSERELVYFAGLVGGQPLPYRLDHNLSVGIKQGLHVSRDETGTTSRLSDSRFWGRIWEAFLARRPLTGPKQFLRVSTPIGPKGTEQADALLESFIADWLQPVAYEAELAGWRKR